MRTEPVALRDQMVCSVSLHDQFVIVAAPDAGAACAVTDAYLIVRAFPDPKVLMVGATLSETEVTEWVREHFKVEDMVASVVAEAFVELMAMNGHE